MNLASATNYVQWLVGRDVKEIELNLPDGKTVKLTLLPANLMESYLRGLTSGYDPESDDFSVLCRELAMLPEWRLKKD